MERPEKRFLSKDMNRDYLQYDKGYNHCWDEWREFLPNSKELESMIDEIAGIVYLERSEDIVDRFRAKVLRNNHKIAAKAIAKRIGKE